MPSIEIPNTTLDVARWIHISFNVCEALVWLAVATVIAIRVPRMARQSRRVSIIAVIGLVAFSASDWVEMFTGTWYSPPALLALNVVCVVVLLPCLVYFYRHRANRKAKEKGKI